MGGSNVITRALGKEGRSVRVKEDVTTQAEVRGWKETNTCTYMHMHKGCYTAGFEDEERCHEPRKAGNLLKLEQAKE